MTELSKARVFFRIGVPFEEALVPKIRSMFRDLLIVDSHKGIKLRAMDSEHEDHEHETSQSGDSHKDAKGDHEEETDDHHHEAGAPDPHVWLDPILVKELGSNICEALSRIDPTNAADYRKNLKGFQSQLDRVNAKIAHALAPIKGKEIFVFHPAYGYFADRYGLKQVAVETGGKEPSAKQLKTLIDKARDAGVKVIFVQPQFDTKYAESITKATGGAVVFLDPLAFEYIKNLEEMAIKVESALSRQK
jgi:zinc transport system substrate-binding protein